MSPILHRDVGEHVRQAKRLAAVVTGRPSLEQDQHEWDSTRRLSNGNAYATASSSRRGMGLREEDEEDTGPPQRRPSWEGQTRAEGEVKGKMRFVEDEAEELEMEDRSLLHPQPNGLTMDDTALRDTSTSGRTSNRTIAEWTKDEVLSMTPSRWIDLRNLLLEVCQHCSSGLSMRRVGLNVQATPALLLNLIGMIFTGELLEHLARWTVFLRVDELFILVPMVGNLKGNLEMCLSARLGTSANIGELDGRSSRKALLKANMSLLALQALLISSLAGGISFLLGLMTRHRLGDIDGSGVTVEPGLETQDQEWHEGYTRPGWAQLVMVLATGMGSAGLSSAILGSFMSSMIVVSRWFGIDPGTSDVSVCSHT